MFFLKNSMKYCWLGEKDKKNCWLVETSHIAISPSFHILWPFSKSLKSNTSDRKDLYFLYFFLLADTLIRIRSRGVPTPHFFTPPFPL